MNLKERKKYCEEQIKKNNNVCDYCGRKIKALKTVDNSGTPTYWAGCMHGSKDYGQFTTGVPIGIYELAFNLVLDDGLRFGLKKDNYDDFSYGFEHQVSSVCRTIQDIEYMKKYKNPRYTKKQLEDRFKKYKKSI